MYIELMKTKEEIIHEAKQRGSSASTLKGAVKYLLHHRDLIFPLPLDGGNRRGVQNFMERESNRKSHPEAKRARDDKKYRENYLRRMAREVERLNRQPDTLAGISAFITNHKSVQTRLDEIAHIRQIIFNQEFSDSISAAKLNVQLVGCAVIGGATPNLDEIRRKKQFSEVSNMLSRGVSWDISAGYASRITRNSFSQSHYHSGRWVTDSYGEHEFKFRSFGLIDKSNPRNLLVAYGDYEFSVVLPEQYRWEMDQNGIKAVCGPDDYHSSMSDLLMSNSRDHICQKLIENANTRRLMAAQLAAEKADAAGIWVCLNDSLNGGNCRMGTENFAQRNRLDIRHHYRAPELLAIGKDDLSRVRLAIKAATLRTQREENQGVALLNEHGF